MHSDDSYKTLDFSGLKILEILFGRSKSASYSNEQILFTSCFAFHVDRMESSGWIIEQSPSDNGKPRKLNNQSLFKVPLITYNAIFKAKGTILVIPL